LGTLQERILCALGPPAIRPLGGLASSNVRVGQTNRNSVNERFTLKSSIEKQEFADC
jgi:hypothetical protein